MKKNLLLIFILIFTLTFMGCGAKEKIAEQVIEGATGVEVDINDEEVTIEGEDGEEITIGGTEWPDSDMAKKIPEFKEGKVSSVVNSAENVMIAIEEVEKQDVLNYAKNFIDTYTYNTFIIKSQEGVTYSGTNNEGLSVSLGYTENDKSLLVSAAQGEAVEQAEPLNDDVAGLISEIITSDMKFPTKGIASLLPPFTSGNIKSVNMGGNMLSVSIGDVELSDFEKYYENFKATFPTDGTEMKNEDSIFYYSALEDGTNVSINYFIKDKTADISITKY